MAVLMIVTVSWISTAWSASPGEVLERALSQRYQPSRIEVDDRAHRGMVRRQGALLTLALGAVPGQPFRVVQHDPTSPVYHVMEYARFEVMADGRVRADPAPLVLPSGTRLVVLDVRVRGDRVHVFTHTAEPLRMSSGGASAYGCTEFIFQLMPAELAAADVEAATRRIEPRLQWTSDVRDCSTRVSPLCLAP